MQTLYDKANKDWVGRHWLWSLGDDILQKMSCWYQCSWICRSSESTHQTRVIVICIVWGSICPLVCALNIPTLFWAHWPVSTKLEKSVIIGKLLHLWKFGQVEEREMLALTLRERPEYKHWYHSYRCLEIPNVGKSSKWTLHLYWTTRNQKMRSCIASLSAHETTSLKLLIGPGFCF